MGPTPCATPHAVSLSRRFNAILCALVVTSSQALVSHGFVTSNTVRFSYRYGGRCPNAELQGNCLNSSAAQTAAAAAAARSSFSAAAAAAGTPPRAYIRGAAAAAAGKLGRTPGAGVGEAGATPVGGANTFSSALFSESPAGSTAGTAADPALLEKIKDVVAEQLKVDREKIELESNFIKDLNADSLDSVELVMAFEEQFGVTIPDEAATKIATVQDALSYIQKAKANDSTPAGGTTTSQA